MQLTNFSFISNDPFWKEMWVSWARRSRRRKEEEEKTEILYFMMNIDGVPSTYYLLPLEQWKRNLSADIFLIVLSWTSLKLYRAARRRKKRGRLCENPNTIHLMAYLPKIVTDWTFLHFVLHVVESLKKKICRNSAKTFWFGTRHQSNT